MSWQKCQSTLDTMVTPSALTCLNFGVSMKAQTRTVQSLVQSGRYCAPISSPWVRNSPLAGFCIPESAETTPSCNINTSSIFQETCENSIVTARTIHSGHFTRTSTRLAQNNCKTQTEIAENWIEAHYTIRDLTESQYTRKLCVLIHGLTRTFAKSSATIVYLELELSDLLSPTHLQSVIS